MSTWTPEDLDALGSSSEIQISTVRPDGTVRTPLPIWVVRVGDELFVRSYHGPDGTWYRQVVAHPEARVRATGQEFAVLLATADAAVRDDVDQAYRSKYGRGGFGAAMTSPAAAATTLRLEPMTAQHE